MTTHMDDYTSTGTIMNQECPKTSHLFGRSYLMSKSGTIPNMSAEVGGYRYFPLGGRSELPKLKARLFKELGRLYTAPGVPRPKKFASVLTKTSPHFARPSLPPLENVHLAEEGRTELGCSPIAGSKNESGASSIFEIAVGAAAASRGRAASSRRSCCCTTAVYDDVVNRCGAAAVAVRSTVMLRLRMIGGGSAGAAVLEHRRTVVEFTAAYVSEDGAGQRRPRYEFHGRRRE